MITSWHLGGTTYVQYMDLGLVQGEGYALHLVREGNDGPRYLLQLWQPRPSNKDMDRLRDIFLRRIVDAEALDPVDIHFGCNDSDAWFLQELEGIPIGKFWPTLSLVQQERFLRHLRELLLRSSSNRMAHPDLVGLKPGRIIIPRILSHRPTDSNILDAWYPLEEREGKSEYLLWEQAPELTEDCARPIRGRTQELTYLKSLMFGLNAPAPMERVTMILGEEGLGQEYLAHFCGGAAETEGFRVVRLDVRHEETTSSFLNRLLRELLKGVEADFYAAHPAEARILARRFESYAFLRGSSPTLLSTGPIDDHERLATLAVMDYVAKLHPLIIIITFLERGEEALVEFTSRLCLVSTMPWVLCFSNMKASPALRSSLGMLRNDQYVAAITLNRLEDTDLQQVMNDILGPNQLPKRYITEVCHESLGNPGLLKSILELTQLEGSLVWENGTWCLGHERDESVRVLDDLAGRILRGRIQRLSPPAIAVLRHLALADHALDIDTLGRSLSIAREPLEDLLNTVDSTKLATLKDGRMELAEPRVRDLSLSTAAPAEIKRMAQSLLKALEETGGRPVLSVRLQSIASDEKTALRNLMGAMEQEPPNPEEALRVVHQALQLNPSPMQQSRLWEFVADAWAQEPSIEFASMKDLEGQSPWEMGIQALESALTALNEAKEGVHERPLIEARLLRKRAFFQLRLRMLSAAFHSIQTAAKYLTDHPLHPEQPRLRLALGRLHLLGGFINRGMKSLEEGLQILRLLGPRADHREQVALLLELGRTQALRSQFQRSLANLQAAQRLLEHDQEYQRLVPVRETLARVFLMQGQTELAYSYLREAIQAARDQDPWEPLARCHLTLGLFRSYQHHLGPALSHLDIALDRFSRARDHIFAKQAQLWKARTLAALGNAIQAELMVLQSLGGYDETMTAGELGEHHFLQAEMAGFQDAWSDSARLYASAAGHFESAGHLWWERLARLRRIQADAQNDPERYRQELAAEDWKSLGSLKSLVDASGSRWLEMEWHKAHALLLSDREATDVLAPEALTAWGEVLASAREMRFSLAAMEASVRCSVLLMHRSERLGARSCLQNAMSSFQELWCWIPESYETSFLGRKDMHQFRLMVDAVGLPWDLPERIDPLADWTPTQLSLPMTKLGKLHR